MKINFNEIEKQRDIKLTYEEYNFLKKCYLDKQKLVIIEKFEFPSFDVTVSFISKDEKDRIIIEELNKFKNMTIKEFKRYKKGIRK